MRTPVAPIVAVVLALAMGGPSMAAQTQESARRVFDQYVFDFWIRRDTSALGRALSPTMIYHYNGRLRPGEPDAHLRALRNFGGAFPDLTATVDVFTTSGDLGAAMTTWTGTHSGMLCQTPGTGTKVTWVVSYMFRIENGRIAELWEAWDEGGTYHGLGLDLSKC